MKKAITAIAVLVLVLASGCGKPNTTVEKSEIDYAKFGLNDKTVKVNTFDLDNYNVDRTIINKSYTEKLFSYIDTEMLYKDCEYSAQGKVLSVKYFDEYAVACTIYTFHIEKVYKGNLKSGDVISIFTRGGYCRLSKQIEEYGEQAKESTQYKNATKEEIDKVLIYESDDGAPDIQVESEYVLFFNLLKNNTFPDGIYRDFGYEGRYYRKGNDKFGRYMGENIENNENFTFEELDKKLEELKKTAEKKAKE
jgi:hypothetical protein